MTQLGKDLHNTSFYSNCQYDVLWNNSTNLLLEHLKHICKQLGNFGIVSFVA